MEKGDTNSYINFFMITTENAELTALVRHIEKFHNQQYRFTILKSTTRLTEKREGEEHGLLQSIMCFTETQ